MKYLSFFLLVVFMAAGCKQKTISGPELENKLMNVMKEHLEKTNNRPDAVFTVKEVVYYPEKEQYICEFKVNVKTASSDTTGTMKAYISNDFKTVKRSQ